MSTAAPTIEPNALQRQAAQDAHESILAQLAQAHERNSAGTRDMLAFYRQLAAQGEDDPALNAQIAALEADLARLQGELDAAVAQENARYAAELAGLGG